MTLDPQVRAFLAEVAEADQPSSEDLTLEEARAAATNYRTLAGRPEAVKSVTHGFLLGPTADLPFRAYRPYRALDERLPALVYFHGGGWILGNIDILDAPHRLLANRAGCTVIAVNYQKAPEHKYPTPLDDCYAATQWVVDNAASLGVASDRIGVGGDSAGGNLAAAVAQRARDRNGPAIAYQLLIYPALLFDSPTTSAEMHAEGCFLDVTTLRYFWRQYVTTPDDGTDPYCSPLLASDVADLPPTLIATAEYDPLRDEGRAYGERLRAAGVPVTLREYEGMIHGFFWMAGILDRTHLVVNEIGDEVGRALHRTPRDPTPMHD